MTSLKNKLILLGVIIFLGLNVNYQPTSVISDEGKEIIFEKIRINFIPLYRENKESQFLFLKSEQKKVIWGYPFGFWETGGFERSEINKIHFNFLIYDLIVYLVVWLIILGLFWFIKGIKKMRSRAKEFERKFRF